MFTGGFMVGVVAGIGVALSVFGELEIRKGR
jgi:hypothetical protein